MIHHDPVRMTLCALALLSSIGCGDSSPASSCEALCQRADSCPNLYAEKDCVSVCEESVKQAQALGGTCPGAIDDVIACQTGLSCSELSVRAVSSFYDDECVAVEQAAVKCEPGDPVGSDPSANQPPDDELALACSGLCDALDACPRTRAESNCLQICVEGYRSAQNGSEACSTAVVDTLNCQSAMSCEEIENRVLGRSVDDACRASDQRAISACL